MKSIYWFRNDLRIIDNLSLNDAIESSDEILFVYMQDVKNLKDTEWKFTRMGSHRKLYICQGLNALQEKLSNYGHSLNYYSDNTVDGLLKLVEKFQIDRIYCESIDSHEELDEEIRLRERKIELYSYYQSGLFLNDQIPFHLNDLPDVFTNFRKERQEVGNYKLLELFLIRIVSILILHFHKALNKSVSLKFLPLL